MPTLDELEIQITADAKAVNTSINSLAKKLETLSTSLKKVEGVNLTSFSSSLKGISSAVGAMKGVSAKKFEDLAKGFNTLSGVKIDASEFNKMSSALSKLGNSAKGMGEINSSVVKFVDATARLASAGQNMVIVSGVMPRFTTNLQSTLTTMSQAPTVANGTIAFTQALGQLANAGAKLNVTTANLGKFGNELLKIITVLSKAPQVSANTIQMTNALANLGSQGSKVATATRKLSAGLNTTHTAMQRASKSTFSLAAAFGKFYASYFLVIRAFKGVGNAIKSTMDYIETANYFNDAFNQVARKADLSAYEKLGYESAEAYAKSFSERAKELTAKMTGYNVGESGVLMPTGAASLGLNPTELMNYQAMFGQMASSMGVASENASKLSKALSMIGADLASWKNQEFSETWDTMASGVVGMSRSWDRYGVNIRNVNLQQKLNELGIQANIDKLNQQDKALLRTIILLENTTGAWGDLAETVKSPANQLRLLEASTQNFARTFGNVFIGLVTEALPYVNGLMIAFERMVRYAGDLFGVDWDASFSAMKSTGENTIISDILDQTEEAQSKLKTLKRQLMGFDEINKLGGDNDSATSNMLDDLSGITVAFDKIYEEYTQNWENAFKKVEDRSNKFADNIIKKLNGVGKKLKPLEEPFKVLIDSLAGLQEFSFGALEEFYNKFLEPLGDWMINDNSGIARFLNITTALNYSINWENLKKAVGDLSEVLATISMISWDSMMTFYNDLLKPLASWTLSEAIPKLADTLKSFVSFVDWEKFGDTLSSAFSLISDVVASVGDAFLRIAQVVMPKLAPVFNDVMSIFNTLLNDRIKPLWEFLKEHLLPVIEFSLTNSLNVFVGVVKSLTGTLDGVLKGITNLVTGVFTADWQKAWEGVTGIFGSVFGGLKGIAESLWGGISAIFTDGGGIPSKIKSGLDKLNGMFSTAFNGVKTTISNIWNSILGIFNKGGVIFDGFVDGVAGVFKSIVNGLIDGINSVIAFPFNRINSMLNNIRDTRILGVKPFYDLWGYNPISVPTIPKLPAYATGGFPEDGLFMANHNELVGKFSNGRTAVANNEQIISGIEAGVYNAVVAALSTASGNNTNVTVVLEGDSAELFRVVQQEGRDYQRMYNREVFA